MFRNVIIGYGTIFSATACSFNRISFTNNCYATSVFGCVIDSLIDPFNMNFSGDTNIVHYASFGGDVSIASGSGYSPGGHTTFDTLYFNNPGHIVTLGATDTLIINKVMEINASGGFPVSLVSSVAGTQATILKATDTVCVNYIYMQDINATGGAQFYAGMYSSNISDNTGWQWTSCSLPISNVWPGDANYDLITNNLDVLYIGIAYNETGFTRPGATLTYTSQPCLDWPAVYTNLVNIKHADCDGNGVIDANDTTAVTLNYGLSNTGRLAAPTTQPTNTSSLPNLYFVPTISTYAPGSFVSIPINLGTSATPASNVYGLAFTVQYDASQIQAGSVGLNYNGSWLTPSNNIVHLEKDFYASSHIDVGMARTNHANISGNGTIANLTFQVSNTAANGPINLSFNNVTVMDWAQTIIPVNTVNNFVTVGINQIDVNVSNINVYPNPFANEANINYSLANASYVTVSVYTPEGMLVSNLDNNMQPAGQHNLVWNASNLASGVYFCKIKCSEGQQVFKLIKAE